MEQKQISQNKPKLFRTLFIAFVIVTIAYFFREKVGLQQERIPVLKVYTYGSFMASGGLGSVLIPMFERECGCRVDASATGNAAQLLTRIQLDFRQGKKPAQVVLGIDHHTWDRFKIYAHPWGDWRPARFTEIQGDAWVGEGFLPYDYGIFAFMGDMEWIGENHFTAPVKVSDLLSSEWRKSILLQDPRTSTPGLAFLLYLDEVLGSEQWNFWTKLRDQWLAIVPGWSEAYSLFTRGEASLVWSYITSQAYHDFNSPREKKYEAILFEEGQPVQVEGAVLVRDSFENSVHEELGKAFLNFLLTNEIQEKIPRTNWMFPVIKNLPLPKEFRSLPKPKKIIHTKNSVEEIETQLRQWELKVAH